MEQDIELTILSHLTTTEPYLRKVLPYLKGEYFSSGSNRVLYKLISDYSEKYGAAPSKEALRVDLDNRTDVNEHTYREVRSAIEALAVDSSTSVDWLVDTTEKFCKEKAIYNALVESNEIITDKNSKKTPDAIPEILSKALAVCFDEYVGHDYIEDAARRHDFYNAKHERIPYDIEYLNRITKGGQPRKSLTVIIAGTNVGKSLVMCHQAAYNLVSGRNVLYITLEMSEEKISERIDANLLDLTTDELATIDKEDFLRRVDRIKQKTVGKLVVKEYPTANAHVGHFKALIAELWLKKKFKPDIIYVDYVNLCNSSRVRASDGNSFTVVKAVAEELRGLAVMTNTVVVTATQLNREGMSSSDVEMTNTSESIGIPFTADLMYAIISSIELEKLNQFMVKQLKNRHDNAAKLRKFVIGVDKDKQRLYDLEDSAQRLSQQPPINVQPKPGFVGGSQRDKLKKFK